MIFYPNLALNKGDKTNINLASPFTIQPRTLINSEYNFNTVETVNNSKISELTSDNEYSNLSKDKSSNKKEISALPDTGEKEKNTTIFASLLIIIGSLLVFRKKKKNV